MIPVSTHNIHFHDKRISINYPQIFVLSYQKNFIGSQKRVRISHGKQAIGVRVIEVNYIYEVFITKTCLFKYTENFTTKK